MFQEWEITHVQTDALCHLLIMTLVNWLHLISSVLKVQCIVQQIKKINISYVKFEVPFLCHSICVACLDAG